MKIVTRGLCPVCDRWILLKKNGTLRHHGGPKGSGAGWSGTNRAFRCGGAGQETPNVHTEEVSSG